MKIIILHFLEKRKVTTKYTKLLKSIVGITYFFLLGKLVSNGQNVNVQ